MNIYIVFNNTSYSECINPFSKGKIHNRFISNIEIISIDFNYKNIIQNYYYEYYKINNQLLEFIKY